MIETGNAEAAVLGACMLAGRVLDEVADVLSPAHFAHPVLRRIYAAALQVDRGGAPVDPVTVLDVLGGDDREAFQACLWLNQTCATTATASHHASMVRGAARLRRLSDIGRAIIGLGAEGNPADVEEVYDAALEMLMQEHRPTAGAVWVDMREAARAVVAEAQRRYEAELAGEAATWYASTGLDKLDEVIEGWQAGHLYTLGAVSGGGKTAFGVYTAWQAAQATGRPVLYVSVEVDAHDMAARLLAALSGVPLVHIRSGGFARTGHHVGLVLHGHERIDAGGGLVRMAYRPGGDAAFVEVAVRRAMREGQEPALVVVDYLQRLRSSTRAHSREREVAEISGALLETAQRHRVAVLALAQLNREVGKRQDKRPVTSDLRESSAIEHDSSVVMFLHRPHLYDENEPEQAAEVVVRKNRNGPQATVPIKYDPPTGRFWT